jgi:hypothetical protein
MSTTTPHRHSSPAVLIKIACSSTIEVCEQPDVVNRSRWEYLRKGYHLHDYYHLTGSDYRQYCASTPSHLSFLSSKITLPAYLPESSFSLSLVASCEEVVLCSTRLLADHSETPLATLGSQRLHTKPNLPRPTPTTPTSHLHSQN